MLRTKWAAKADQFLIKHLSGEAIGWRQVVALFLPVLLDQTFVVCLNLVNTAMISSAGIEAVSAVNMVDSLNIFLMNVFIAVATGGTVVVAQYKGRGDDGMPARAATASITAAFLLAVCISALFVGFHEPILRLLFGKASPGVLRAARVYLIGSGLSYGGAAVVEAVCGALRGIGETRSSLTLSLIMNLSYVLLNVVFINLLHLSVLGMCIAVNIARCLAAFCALYYLLRINTALRIRLGELFHLRFDMLRRIFFIGLPFAAEQMFFNGGKILTQTFIVSLGTLALDTNAICNSMCGLFQIPANALSLTVITVVGQCMGRRNVKDARRFIRAFIVLSALSYVVTSAVILPAFRPIVSLFEPPQSVVPIVFRILLINAAAQILLWSPSFVTPSALRAAGDSKFTSVVSMLSMWLFRVVMGYILGIVLRFGIMGVWFAMDCEWGVRSIVFVVRLRGNRWHAHHVID